MTVDEQAAEETREERRRRLARDRARRSRERRREREEALRPEQAAERVREAVIERVESHDVLPEDRGRSSSGDGKLLGAVHGWGGTHPTILSFRRDAQGPPDYEAWLAMPIEEPEQPVCVVVPGEVKLSFFRSDGASEVARVAERVAEVTGLHPNQVRERISRFAAGTHVISH